VSYLLEFFIKYYARDPCVRFNSVKADNEKPVVDRRLDRPDTRIDDALPREIRITDVHLISSVVKTSKTDNHQQKPTENPRLSPLFSVCECSLLLKERAQN
jgi:hypothetical protein